MDKREYFKGFCPVINENMEIVIDYLDASTGLRKEYVKGRMHCINEKKCNTDCPIYENAPMNTQ